MPTITDEVSPEVADALSRQARALDPELATAPPRGAVVMADVGDQTIVGAGAVVTTPLPDRVVAAGVPARVVKSRD